MAVDVRINGADYPDVPAIDVPKTNNGGTATFYDCSGDTATAADVASGKTCHTAGGLITGTAVPATGTDGFLFEMQASGASPKSFSGASGSTFYGLHGLKNISISGATTIVAKVFSGCNTLENVVGSDIETLGTDAFYNCTNLISAVFPKIETLGSGAFQNCTNLISAVFPKLRTVSTSTFAYCKKLTQANFPLLRNIPDSAFERCQQLLSSEVDFSSVQSIGYNCFYNCEALTSLRFPALNAAIARYAFDSCYALTDVYIGSTTLIGLANVNAFNNTPIAMSGSHASADARIHVRAELLNDFKTATNWSIFADKIVGDYTD